MSSDIYDLAPIMTIQPRITLASQFLTQIGYKMLHIGKNISLLLTRVGKDARWLSGEVDVDESTVSLWISGKRTPTVKNLEKICVALNAEMHEIWYGPQAIPATAPAQALLSIANNLPADRLEALLAIAKTLETQN